MGEGGEVGHVAADWRVGSKQRAEVVLVVGRVMWVVEIEVTVSLLGEEDGIGSSLGGLELGTLDVEADPVGVREVVRSTEWFSPKFRVMVLMKVFIVVVVVVVVYSVDWDEVDDFARGP